VNSQCSPTAQAPSKAFAAFVTEGHAALREYGFGE
jgi:hypothetical protein